MQNLLPIQGYQDTDLASFKVMCHNSDSYKRTVATAE